MKDYLISFFDEFKYAPEDAQCLIGAYDQICAHEAASGLLSDILAAYEANFLLSCQKEVFERAKEISNLTGIHPYTTDLLVCICLTKRLRELYLEKGFDLQLYRNCGYDTRWKLEECKLLKGVCGTFVASWYSGFFGLRRFGFGRLQFDLGRARCDYNKNGLKLEKDKSFVLNVHIPRTGTPLTKESCDEAYAAAKEFFQKQTGEDCPFACHSWLLYPENKEILPPHTNTYRFMSEFDIIDWGINDGEDLWRLFDTDEKDPDKLPTNGSLRRCYVADLIKGCAVGWGYGIKP